MMNRKFVSHLPQIPKSMIKYIISSCILYYFFTSKLHNNQVFQLLEVILKTKWRKLKNNWEGVLASKCKCKCIYFINSVKYEYFYMTIGHTMVKID